MSRIIYTYIIILIIVRVPGLPQHESSGAWARSTRRLDETVRRDETRRLHDTLTRVGAAPPPASAARHVLSPGFVYTISLTRLV